MGQIVNKLVIIGAGMMGSSLVQAVKKANISKSVTVIVSKDQYINILKEQKILATKSYECVQDADLVVICSNLASYEGIINLLNQNVSINTIITDIGSVKEYCENLFDDKYKFVDSYIPAHPIAGSEKSGFGVVVENLYQGKNLIITRKNAKSKIVSSFFKALGMNIEYLSSQQHDQIFAEISHLPQFLAFECWQITDSFKHDLNSLNNQKIQIFLRLGDSDKKLWDEIFAYNMQKLVDLVCRYRKSYGDNLNDEIFYTKLFKYKDDLASFDQNLNSGNYDIDLKPIQQIIVSYLDCVEKDSYKFAGTGFRDFIQPIFD